MIEATFPVLGTAFVVAVVLPAFALLAKAGLTVLEREDVGGPLHGLNLRYILLTGSSALPLAWLLSACLHQVEPGRSALACLYDNGVTERCFEPGFFALVLALMVVGAAVTVLRRHRQAHISTSDAACALRDRVVDIVASDAGLTCLQGRVLVTEDRGLALETHGWLNPRVFIGVDFASRLTDEMLASALAHEAEHVRALDPLRYAILELALSLNPVGRLLLQPHAARWRAAREAHCDRDAVIGGAAPLSLANAIVQAARPRPSEAVTLGGRDVALLNFRIGLLLAFAERPPTRCCRKGQSAFPVPLFLLVIALFLPHQTGTAALDALHQGAEHALTYFLY